MIGSDNLTSAPAIEPSVSEARDGRPEDGNGGFGIGHLCCLDRASSPEVHADEDSLLIDWASRSRRCARWRRPLRNSPQACSDQAFFLDDLTAAFFVVLRLVADFLGVSADLAVLAAFFFAFFLGGPAAARAANKSSAS